MMKGSSMSVQETRKRIRNFHPVELGFSRKVAIDEARQFPQSHIPSCQPRCPLGIDILEFVRLLREGDVTQAQAKIAEANELPSICGRVCMAPCEGGLAIGGKREALDVRALERFAADHGGGPVPSFKRNVLSGPRVAVIGSGPAGLSAAGRLARKNFQVTVFESLPQPGGMLRYGIPEFRLAKSVVDGEIRRLERLGVVFVVNCPIGSVRTLDDLREEGYTAAVLAPGRLCVQPSTVAGSDAQHVFYTEEVMLKLGVSREAFEAGFRQALGDRVVVVGRDYSALDAARSCVRLGKKVSLVFAGQEDDFRARSSDLVYAREEGVALESMAQFHHVVVAADGSVKGAAASRMDYADKGGTWVAVPVPHSQFEIPADSVILSSMRRVHPQIQAMLPGALWHRDGSVEVAGARVNGIPVVAAGAMAVADDGIVDAIRSGQEAAQRVVDILGQEG